MDNMSIFYIQSLIYILASSQSIYISLSLSIYICTQIFFTRMGKGV